MGISIRSPITLAGICGNVRSSSLIRGSNVDSRPHGLLVPLSIPGPGLLSMQISQPPMRFDLPGRADPSTSPPSDGHLSQAAAESREASGAREGSPDDPHLGRGGRAVDRCRRDDGPEPAVHR